MYLKVTLGLHEYFVADTTNAGLMADFMVQLQPVEEEYMPNGPARFKKSTHMVKRLEIIDEEMPVIFPRDTP